jgi:hypothetical protein
LENLICGGRTRTNEFFVIVFEQPSALVIVSETLKSPSLVYVWEGFCAVDVLPSPKFHSQVAAAGALALKLTVNGAWQAPVAGAEKSTAGLSDTTMGLVIESLQVV